MKNSQEIVRASLLPFFTYAAEDLNNLIQDLQANRLANVKGTSQKTNAYLDYIHMVLLPVLASMFEHLSANKYGTDVLGKLARLVLIVGFRGVTAAFVAFESWRDSASVL